MADDLKRTVRIVRRSKVSTDDRGRSVWTDPVETAELELVSTTMLKRVLTGDDEARKQQIREAAKGKDGVLAHDPDHDRFEIIDDNDLQSAIEAQQSAGIETRSADVVLEPLKESSDADDEELSLVSTQMLRQMIGIEDDVAAEAPGDPDDDGFDPYNTG